MKGPSIPLDKAELLSVLLEGILYGFSLLMFGGTIWTLLFYRHGHSMNSRMFSVACALLLCSTAHLAIHILRVMDGLITHRSDYHNGPVGYFSDVSKWTFNAKNHAYTVQTLIGDGVILYRCYIVWQSKLIMILPVLLWCATAITGFMIGYTSARATQAGVFGGPLSLWITSWWATALGTNLLITLLLIFRIWDVDRKARELRSHRQSQLRKILHILIDAGAIYTMTLLVALICFLLQTNGQYVLLDMVTPVISITFYMVIIRVGLTTRSNMSNMSTDIPLGNSLDNIASAERRRMQICVTTLTESKIDRNRFSPNMSSTSTRFGEEDVKRERVAESWGGEKKARG